MSRAIVWVVLLVLSGESAQAQFLSHIELGGGLRNERITSWPHHEYHLTGPHPTLSATTPFHWGDLNLEVGFADLQRNRDTGLDIHRIRMTLLWNTGIRLRKSLAIRPMIGFGFDRYSHPEATFNPSEIENLIAGGIAVEQEIGRWLLSVDSKWVRVWSYRNLDTHSVGIAIRYRLAVPESWRHVVR